MSVWSILFFVTGVQQHLSRTQPLLSSLGPIGSDNLQAVSAHFHGYSVGITGLLHYPNIPCTYIYCRSGCWKGHRSPHESRLSSRGVIIFLQIPGQFKLFILVSVIFRKVVFLEMGMLTSCQTLLLYLGLGPTVALEVTGGIRVDWP